MDISSDLLINAIVAGLLLGGFYAAVTAGVSISFGMLDIVNIAHPAFVILGSYIAYFININFGVDPILVSIVVLPAFYALGALVYQVYYLSFEKRGQESLRGLAFFFGLLFVTEVSLILVFGVDYRYVEAAYIGPSIHIGLSTCRCACWCPAWRRWRCSARIELFVTRTFIGRAIMAVSQDQLALQLMAADPIRIKRIAFGISIATASVGRRAAHHHPAGRALGRARIYRPRVRHLRARRARQHARHADRGHAARRRREPDRDLLRPVMGAGGGVRFSPADAGLPAGGTFGTVSRVNTAKFSLYRDRGRRCWSWPSRIG